MLKILQPCDVSSGHPNDLLLFIKSHVENIHGDVISMLNIITSEVFQNHKVSHDFTRVVVCCECFKCVISVVNVVSVMSVVSVVSVCDKC